MQRNCSDLRQMNQQGYTLLELLVVLVILGLMIGFATPKVLGYLSGARTDAAELQVLQLGSALDLFYLDNRRYPGTDEGLEALVADPGDLVTWKGPYLKRGDLPDDPWGFAFQYEGPGDGEPFALFSLGADNAVGGEGEDRDVYYK